MSSPPPLTRNQRIVFVAVTLAVAATRFFALSHSLWDWDEALFCMALGDYDITQHHPHPPGFPSFIFLAKIARLFVSKDFHALRAVVMVAALAVFPSAFDLARQLGLRFRTAILGALLFSFLPNVWYYGGTAFTDIPSIVTVFVAIAATLRGRYDRRWYFIGSLLIGFAVTFRPQNALMALYPWLAASWPRFRERRFDPVLAAVASLAVAVIAYGGAALATGSVREFIGAVQAHSHYVAQVDSFRNPARTPVRKLLAPFGIDPFRAGRVQYYIFVAALISIASSIFRKQKAALEIVLIFGPFFIVSLFMLSETGVGRLSIGYLPMHALLAADGMAVIAALFAFRREWLLALLQTAFALAIVGRDVQWVAPALAEVRRHDSPPIEAMRWLTRNTPKDAHIYVQGGMVPFADYLLAGRDYEFVDDRPIFTLDPRGGRAWYVADGASGAEEVINFRRPRQRLWFLFLQRYFEVSVRRVVGGTLFDEGWYGEESSGEAVWRWMPAHGRILLQPLGRYGELTLAIYTPLDAEAPPLVTVRVDGVVVEQFRPTAAEIEKRFRLDARAPKAVAVTIDVDHVIHPKGDSRTQGLGLRLSRYAWKPID